MKGSRGLGLQLEYVSTVQQYVLLTEEVVQGV